MTVKQSTLHISGNQIPYMGQLQQKKCIFLTGLEAGHPNSRCQQGGFPLKDTGKGLFQARIITLLFKKKRKIKKQEKKLLEITNTVVEIKNSTEGLKGQVEKYFKKNKSREAAHGNMWPIAKTATMLHTPCVHAVPVSSGRYSQNATGWAA